MATPYVREYHEDREITGWFLLDLSPSVDFGTVDGERAKRTVLTDFVATLARLLTRRGNRVGAIFFGAEVEHVIPAGSGRAQVLRIVDDLLAHPSPPKAPLTDLSRLFEVADRTIRRRSHVIIVSDFISAPGWERGLDLLNRRHELLAVRLVDPRETDLPDVGQILLQDAETGEQLLVDTHDARFRQRFRDSTAAREAAIAASFRRVGVPAATLSTEDDLIAAIIRMATLRRTRRVA